MLNAIAIGVFALFGIFAQKGSKAAFILGLLVYSGDTALLFLGGFTTPPIVSIVIHGIFLFGIIKAFRHLEG